MEEKMEKLYQEYLTEKLDLVFNNETGEKVDVDITKEYLEYVLGYKIEGFVDGYGEIVDDNNNFNVIDKLGKKMGSTYEAFEENKNKPEFIKFVGKYGKPLDTTHYNKDYPYRFEKYSDGFAIVSKLEQQEDESNKFKKVYNFVSIDEPTELISDEWYDNADFNGGIAEVEKYYYNFYDERYEKYNSMDLNGKQINKKWYKNKSKASLKAKDYYKKNLKNYIPSKMTDYSIKKRLFRGYKCSNSYDKFLVKYKPLKDYGNSYVLCINEDNFYLYNRKTKEYEDIGKKIIYNDQFIYYSSKSDINNKEYRVYFMYGDNKLDITDYYKNNLVNRLKDSNVLNITPNIEILSKIDFDYLNIDEKNKFLSEEKEKNRKIREQQEKLKQEQNIKNAEKAKSEEKEKLNLELVDTLIALKNNVDKVNELKGRLGNIKIPKVIVDNALMEVADHKEIVNEIKDKLQFIDLSTISFKDVDISGIDFRGCNIHLFPQEVYKRDLRNCDFTGINIDPFMNFRGVDIRGAKFSIDNDPSTLDVMPKFTGAIYDETTTYNGKSLVDILGPCEEIKKDVNNRRKNR